MAAIAPGHLDILSKLVKRRIKALKKLQVECFKIEAEYANEIFQLEIKYAAKYEPFYNKRKDIINGTYEPNDEECDFPSDGEDSDEETGDEGEDEGKKSDAQSDNVSSDTRKTSANHMKSMDENIRGIPGFWLTSLKNVDAICKKIRLRDEPILAHLTDVTFKQVQEPSSFTLKFHFSPNEYFTNSVLTKTYEVSTQVDSKDPYSFDGISLRNPKGCTIDWKRGKNVTVRTIQRNLKLSPSSFFNFFDPVTNTDGESDALMKAESRMGEFFKYILIPRAVQCFTGDGPDENDLEDLPEPEDEIEDIPLPIEPTSDEFSIFSSCIVSG